MLRKAVMAPMIVITINSSISVKPSDNLTIPFRRRIGVNVPFPVIYLEFSAIQNLPHWEGHRGRLVCCIRNVSSFASATQPSPWGDL